MSTPIDASVTVPGSIARGAEHPRPEAVHSAAVTATWQLATLPDSAQWNRVRDDHTTRRNYRKREPHRVGFHRELPARDLLLTRDRPASRAADWYRRPPRLQHRAWPVTKRFERGADGVHRAIRVRPSTDRERN